MKTPLKTSLVVLAGLCAFGAVAAQQGQTAVLWPAADIKWSDNPAITGAKIAVLWGDPKAGAYGALKTLPAGSTLRLHTHTYDQKVLLLSGAIVLSVQGGASKELRSGSYAFIPGGVKHSAKCKAGARCVYFEEQPGASDIKFVEGAK